MNQKEKRIYVAGSGGMVGSSLVRSLRAAGYQNLIVRTSAELDLTDQSMVTRFFAEEKPDIVILAAAKVGGILANNNFRAEFLYINLMIEANVIRSAFERGVEKLIFLGSSCIYPKFAQQPIKEEYLLSGKLESTNEPYAIAKIVGLKLCESYFAQYDANFYSVMPPNLYGSFDTFDLRYSHVIPAMIRRFHEAKLDHDQSVTLWGTGTARREFMYVDDLADGIRFLLENVNAADIYDRDLSHINVGSGEDIQISNLAALIAGIVGYEGNVEYDPTKPDGMMKKLMDSSRMSILGWKPTTSLKDGIEETYKWYLANEAVRSQSV